MRRKNSLRREQQQQQRKLFDHKLHKADYLWHKKIFPRNFQFISLLPLLFLEKRSLERETIETKVANERVRLYKNLLTIKCSKKLFTLIFKSLLKSQLEALLMSIILYYEQCIFQISLSYVEEQENSS